MTNILKLLLFISPVILAGVVHTLVIKFDLFTWSKQPIDFGFSLGGRPIFGDNKTFRGFLVMIGTSTITAWLLSFIISPGWLPQHFTVVTQQKDALLWGFLLGLGYSLGELPNSFIKRRINIDPGKRPLGWSKCVFYLLDLADSSLGAVLLLYLVYRGSLGFFISLVILGTLVHLIFDLALYLFEVKKLEWSPETVSPRLISFCLVLVYVFSRLILFVWAKNRIYLASDFKIEKRQEQKYIIAVNHRSRLDPFLATAALPWPDFKNLIPIRYMTKDDYLKHVWQQIFLYPIGCFPAKLSNHSKKGLDLATEFLDKGQTVFIFPEGKIIKGTASSQAKVGVALLALRRQANVIPIYLDWLNTRKNNNAHLSLSVYVGSEMNISANTTDPQLTADTILANIYSLDKSRYTG